MSLIASPPRAPEVAAPRSPRRPARPAALWANLALALAVLGASGGLRAWQARHIDFEIRKGRKCPFPLATLPTRLGNWTGSDDPLDPAIARATGCTDHAFRTYIDDRTGAKLGVIVLYGPAADVFIHSPENCYPAQGYDKVEGPDLRRVRVGHQTVPFRALVYTKGEGGQADREEVYYTWRYDGRWDPALPTMKVTERIPGMFKVHLSRRVAEGEFRTEDNPCEDLLAHLVPAIQARLAAPPAPASTPAR